MTLEQAFQTWLKANHFADPLKDEPEIYEQIRDIWYAGAVSLFHIMKTEGIEAAPFVYGELTEYVKKVNEAHMKERMKWHSTS